VLLLMSVVFLFAGVVVWLFDRFTVGVAGLGVALLVCAVLCLWPILCLGKGQSFRAQVSFFDHTTSRFAQPVSDLFDEEFIVV